MSGPPPLTERLLCRCLPAGIVGRSIAGDLREEYVVRKRERGSRSANWWYRRQAIAIGLPYLLVPRRRRRKQESSLGRSSGVVGSVWHDLRFAARAMLGAPGFTFASAGTLALGIGAVTIVFSITDGVLLKPLPYPAPERIVSVSEDNPGIDMPVGWASMQNYLDWKEQCEAFESLALFRGRSMSFTDDGRPEYAYGAFVTSEFFSTFAVSPLMGRVLDPEENTPGNDDVVVLAHGVWESRFGRDPAMVGKLVEVDGVRRRVIGVMPRGFDAPARWISPDVHMALWIPMPVERDSPEAGRDNRSYNVVGRLADGVTLDEARSDVQVVHDRLREAYPVANGAWHAQLFSWREVIVGRVRPALLLILGAAALMLLIACANVANLTLHRMLSRKGELAVRTALGAGRGRVVRQLLTESLLLAIVGGTIGVCLAFAGMELLRGLNPGNIPRWNDVGIDGRALAVTFLVTASAATIFGIVAAARSPRALAVGRTARTREHHRTQGVIVVAQLALSLALVVGATLMARSFARLLDVPPGLNPDNVLTATVVLSWDRVNTIEARTEFVRHALVELESLPGVSSAAMINSLPFSGSNAIMPFVVEGHPIADRSAPPAAAFRGISPSYLSTMEIPLLAGRDFVQSDIVEPRNVLINERMARAHFPGSEAVGGRLAIWNADAAPEQSEWLTIVGVTGNVLHFGLDQDVLPEVYLPYSADYLRSKTFVLKTEGRPGRLAPAVRDRLAIVDPLQPIRDIRPMTAYLASSVANPRFNAVMLTLASLTALALSVVGLFGVVACAAKERTWEMALRLALGAERRSVLALVLRRGLWLGAAGVALGLALALALAGTLEHLLFGIHPTDLTTYLVVSIVFLFLSVAASLFPAIVASRIDPMTVLRAE